MAEFNQATEFENEAFNIQTESKRNQIDKKLAEIDHDAAQRIAALQQAYDEKCKALLEQK